MNKLKQKINVGSKLTVFALLLVGLTPLPVHAATQTVALETVIASDDPVMAGGVSASGIGVNLVAPLDSTTTQLNTGSGSPWGYTWHLNIPELCEGATVQSIRIVTSTETENEDQAGVGWHGIFLTLYSPNPSIGFLSSSYTIAEGEDMNTWGPGIFGFPTPGVDRGIAWGSTFPADLGLSGPLDATWDMSGYNFSEPLGIYIQQMSDIPTLQTTIESVTLTYDDSGCSSTVGSTASSEDTSGTTLAGTGENKMMFTALAALLVATGLGVVTHRRRLSLS